MDADDLADRIAIGDLLTRYATAVDRRDWDLYRTVFTEDAHIDYTSAGGIAGGVSAAVGDGGWSSAPTVAGAVGLAMAVGLWVCARWWRGLDEAAQEAHKWAWWWGSSL